MAPEGGAAGSRKLHRRGTSSSVSHPTSGGSRTRSFNLGQRAPVACPFPLDLSRCQLVLLGCTPQNGSLAIGRPAPGFPSAWCTDQGGWTLRPGIYRYHRASNPAPQSRQRACTSPGGAALPFATSLAYGHHLSTSLVQGRGCPSFRQLGASDLSGAASKHPPASCRAVQGGLDFAAGCPEGINCSIILAIDPVKQGDDFFYLPSFSHRPLNRKSSASSRFQSHGSAL